MPQEYVGQGMALAPPHPHGGEDHLAAFAAFDELTIKQLLIHLPVRLSGLGKFDPASRGDN